MKIWTEPDVRLIGRTQFINPNVWPFENTDSKSDAELIVEHAGRVCYLSFGDKRGNKKNSDYIKNIIKMKHGSVLEHTIYSFLIQGISRACSHEIVRHRHLSFSQLSQRYVDHKETDLVIHPEFFLGMSEEEKSDLLKRIEDSFNNTLQLYNDLTEKFTQKYKDFKFEGLEQHEINRIKRKMARQASRMVLPNMTETKMVVSGNARAWRNFIEKRASMNSDLEIRILAIKILKILQEESPHIFGDFQITKFSDGTLIAKTEFEGV